MTAASPSKSKRTARSAAPVAPPSGRKWNSRRRSVGALTMETSVAADDDVMRWIADGFALRPKAYRFESPSDTVEIPSKACVRLGL